MYLLYIEMTSLKRKRDRHLAVLFADDIDEYNHSCMYEEARRPRGEENAQRQQLQNRLACTARRLREVRSGDPG